MHPRNPYNSPPDFQQLAEAYPALEPHLVKLRNGDVTIDFRDEASQRRLTEALLFRDFELVVTIPGDRLCPTVPNRLNYILWLEDLLTSTASSDAPASSRDTPCRGIDIGTGASAIYPLLACRISPRWTMIGTDIDPASLQSAKSNVERNDLSSRISIVESQGVDVPGARMFPPELGDRTETVFDFTMCNPPFYSSKEDVSRSAEEKAFAPNAVCTGADVEMITPGGEAEFVRRMVEESLLLRERCRWYTSMLGKLSSLGEVVEVLRKNKIDNYAITEFVQGQTRRWAIGWSFGEMRAPDSISRISNPTVQHLMPPKSTLYQSFDYPLSSSTVPATFVRTVHPSTTSTAPATHPRTEVSPVTSQSPLEIVRAVLSTIPELEVKPGCFATAASSSAIFGSHSISSSHTTSTHDSKPISSTSSTKLIRPPDLASLSSASVSSSTSPNGHEHLIVSARRNTWSRSARRANANANASRKRKRGAEGLVKNIGGEEDDQWSEPATTKEERQTSSLASLETLLEAESPVLVCRVFIVHETSQHRDGIGSVDEQETVAEPETDISTKIKVGFEWVRSKDRSVFEGFVSHVGRKLRDGGGARHG